MFEAEVCFYMRNMSHVFLERGMKTKKTKYKKNTKGRGGQPS